MKFTNETISSSSMSGREKTATKLEFELLPVNTAEAITHSTKTRHVLEAIVVPDVFEYR